MTTRCPPAGIKSIKRLDADARGIDQAHARTTPDLSELYGRLVSASGPLSWGT